MVNADSMADLTRPGREPGRSNHHSAMHGVPPIRQARVMTPCRVTGCSIQRATRQSGALWLVGDFRLAQGEVNSQAAELQMPLCVCRPSGCFGSEKVVLDGGSLEDVQHGRGMGPAP